MKTSPSQDKTFYDRFYANVTHKTFRDEIVKLLDSHPGNLEFFDETRKLFGEETDTTWILEWVVDNFSPEEVFDVQRLYNWADCNGLKREE